jgi:RimJ/RimL family protein N-acetyltransferase
MAVTFNILLGEKTILRPFTEDNITPVYIGWLNDPRVTRFSNQRFHQHDQASSQAYLKTFTDSHNLFISVHERFEGCAIGTMTVYINRHHNTADIGLLIGAPASWGKGYGQDAWNTLGNWLLNTVKIRKLTAGAAIGNNAMVRIMERFGMQHEATRYAQELIDDAPHDLVYYAKFDNT